VPYPPVKEPRVTNKKAYLDSIWNDRGIKGDKISGNQWYLQQVIRAMNQVTKNHKKYSKLPSVFQLNLFETTSPRLSEG